MIADKNQWCLDLSPRLPDEDKRHRLCIFGEWIKEDGRHEYFQAFRVPKSKETFQIANCGMGCVLIERWLVKMVSEEFDLPCEERMVWYFDWGEEWWIRDERMDYDKAKNWMLRFKRRMSEDLLFFERCRDFGATLWCNPTVQCEHFSGGDVISIKHTYENKYYSPNARKKPLCRTTYWTNPITEIDWNTRIPDYSPTMTGMSELEVERMS